MSEPQPPASSPVANWYPDPQNPAALRYWDGTQWTSHVASAAGPGPAGASAQGKSGMGVGAIIALSVGGVLLISMAIAVIIPIFISQQRKATDLDAKADVSTIGLAIATHFVDSSQPPVITSNGEEYVLDGASPPYDTVQQSPGVEFGGFDASSNVDWCVWVTAPEGQIGDFRYSAAGGLEEGRC
jgi:type II secretory pathway pseudopilin PulG